MAAPLAHRVFPATVVVALICALAVPAKYQRWVAGAGDALRVVTAPVSGPVRWVAAWIAPRRQIEDERVAELTRQLEFARGVSLQLDQENARLRQLVKDLRVDLGPAKRPSIRQIEASVIGTSSDPGSGLLTVRAGAHEGVQAGAVAVAPGLQLMGRVVAAAERTSTVRPITARGAEPLAALVVLQEGSADGLRCTLLPAGDGTLRGPVMDRRDPTSGAAIEPKVDQLVRLDDPSWPAGLRLLLIVGRVTAVEASPDQPLRRLITVRPLTDLDRMGEVLVWATGEEGAP